MGTESQYAHGDLPSWASVYYQFDAEGNEGALPSHLHAGVSELRLDCAYSGHVHAPVRARLQRLRLAECVHRGAPEEGAGHQFT